MSSVLEVDTEVCRAVQRFRSQLTEDRRRSPRQPFPVVRYIAKATGQEVPEETAFFPVQCRDMSTHGFSFFVKTRPQFKSLVLALDARPKPIYIMAQVRHCTDVLLHWSGQVEVLDDQGAGADRKCSAADAGFWVLVGCEFTQRLPGPENQRSVTE